ncbi:DUF6538 domain-containing protein [Cobetia amphilecti]|uniref:Site-specific integrase n=2 Tax=Cobetia amphilecti TaxID=1055104 RepID=A0ABT6UUL7_9GAMM|nr:site-specific integrase [Cobetia amphilecti]
MPYGTYLIRSRHASQWYARIIIPHDVREHFRQRREIRKTLNTSCKKTAKRRVLAVWLAYQDVFDALRKGQPVTTVFPADWGALADLTTAIESPESLSLHPSNRHPRDSVVFSRIEPIRVSCPRTREVLTVNLVTINPVTGEITVADATDADIRLVKELVPSVWRERAALTSPPALPEASTSLSPRLSELWGAFEEESLANVKDKTRQTIRQALAVFIDIVGDVPASQLDKKLTRSFAKELARYPAQRTKGKWGAMSLEEIRRHDPKIISHKTQSNIFNNLHNFAGWMVEAEILSSNPFTRRRVQKAQQPPSRKTWCDAELKLWFSSESYLQYRDSSTERWKYWLPLLAIYSGARLEELAALAPTDVSEYKGIYFFEIHGRDGRSVKTLSSWRYVPLHPHLIERGLLDYVSGRKGKERLFELNPYRGEYGKRASKAFTNMRKSLGLKPTFHGYRHTVAEALRLKDVSTEHIAWLLGHAGVTITDHYGSDADKRKRLPILSEVVNMLDWSDVV